MKTETEQLDTKNRVVVLSDDISIMLERGWVLSVCRKATNDYVAILRKSFKSHPPANRGRITELSAGGFRISEAIEALHNITYDFLRQGLV